MRPGMANGENAVIAFWWGAESLEKGSGGFATYASITIRLFGELSGMKPIWNIADHGGKHDDPVNGPPTN